MIHLLKVHVVYGYIHGIFSIDPYYAMYSATVATILEGNRLDEYESLNLPDCPEPDCKNSK